MNFYLRMRRAVPRTPRGHKRVHRRFARINCVAINEATWNCGAGLGFGFGVGVGMEMAVTGRLAGNTIQPAQPRPFSYNPKLKFR